MTAWRGVIELLLAGGAAVACVLSWLAAGTEVAVAPVLEGEPATISMEYYPPLLTLALLFATAAGVLAVLGVARLRRGVSVRVDHLRRPQ